MELKLVPKLQQSLVMTPQLKMAIKLLTLNHLELKDAVAQELIDNPVLEEVNDDTSRATATDVETHAEAAAPVPERAAEVSMGPGQQPEATANIDTRSEARIQEALAVVLKGRTAIVVAHRLSTVRDADQILVLAQGQIVERGSHDELVAKHGFYARMLQRIAG